MRSRLIMIPLLVISACAAPPTGPTVAVMPVPGKPFAVFQVEQAQCKQYAAGETAGAAEQANLRQLGTVVVGTVLGGGLGAALGNVRGAAIGAATGALGGAAFGVGPGARDGNMLQYRYGVAYAQCMTTRGNALAFR